MTANNGVPRDMTEAHAFEARLFIDGRFVDASDGGVFPTYDPATGSLLTQVSSATEVDVDRAASVARRAFESGWRDVGPFERVGMLHRIADALEARSEDVALIECLNAGKPIAEARGYAARIADRIRYFADLSRFLRTEVVDPPVGFLNYRTRSPVGVVGAIVPWNFPIGMAALKLAPALAAGNCVILKPASYTPLSALLLAGVCRDAGLPNGVLAVLPGNGGVVGGAIVEHPEVNMVTFTGSTDVGRFIGERSGRSLKKVVLELGGKSPNIVFADADLRAAARTSFYMFAYNSGQVCSAGSRLLLQRSCRDEFMELMLTEASRIRLGNPRDPGTEIGPVISRQHLERIQSYVDRGIGEGAQLIFGGTEASIAGFEGGAFYSPTMFSGISRDMTIFREEIFGPVVCVSEFEDEAEAVRIGNDSSYGLSAAVWTTDLSRAHRMASRLEAGAVFVNTMNDGRGFGLPLEGWKQSGVGVENGIEGMLEFTRGKSVIVNLDMPAPAFS